MNPTPEGSVAWFLNGAVELETAPEFVELGKIDCTPFVCLYEYLSLFFQV